MSANRRRWTLTALAGALLLLLLGLELAGWPHGPQATLAQEGNVHLPIISSGAGTPGPTPTFTPTSVPTPVPSPTFAPGAQTTSNGQCAEGFHLVHATGNLGIVNPATFDGIDADDKPIPGFQPADPATRFADYRCVPDQSPNDISCNGHGAPVVLGGVASCSCNEGYAGNACQVCAAGFARDGSNQCAPVPQPTPFAAVLLPEDAVEAGSVVELVAAILSEGQPAPGVASPSAPGQWTIEHGFGCFVESLQSDVCKDTVFGDKAYLKTPSNGQLNITAIKFVPNGATNVPVVGEVLSQPPGYIPINGFGRPQLQPILNNLVDFMKTRCVGAAVLGVALNGKPVAVYGLGKTFGRASSTIFDPACGSNANDPHQPAAPNTGNQMAIRIGSVSKTVTFATARWVLKGALAAWDTDLDIVALGSNRVVTAQRRSDGALRLQVFNVDATGVTGTPSNAVTAGGFKDFDLVALSATRVAVLARGTDDSLALLVYDISAPGVISLRASNAITGLPGFGGDRIYEARGGRVSDTRLTAAVRRADDTVTILTWDIGGNGAATLASGQPLETRARDVDLAILHASTETRALLVTRAANNNLALFWYNIQSGGNWVEAADTSVFGAIEDPIVQALSDARFIVGVRQADGTLKIYSGDLTNTVSPQIELRDSDTAGAIGDLALGRIGPSGVAAVVRTANGNLRITSWVLDGAGNLTRRGNGDAGTNNGAAMANLTFGSETPTGIAYVAVRTGNQALNVIAWNVTGPTPARLAKEGVGVPVADYPWTDGDVERLRLVSFGLPQGLLSEPARSYFGGEQALPLTLPAVMSGTTTLCNTPAGGLAEPEWKQVQLKHLFAHRTGMPRTFQPEFEDLFNDYIATLRGLNSQAAWAAQEADLRTRFGSASVEAGRAALGWNTTLVQNGPTSGYFVPLQTMQEWAQVFASRCLPFPFEVYSYSNTSPQIMRAVIEHVSGQPYVYAEGFPAQHDQSLLRQFLAGAGIETSPTNNIFPSRNWTTGANDNGDPGPVVRDWDADAGTYYPLRWDIKRPFCTWNGATCSFSAWKNQNDGTVAWFWGKNQVRFEQAGAALGTATGGLRAEPQSFLKFMAQYWAGGYNDGATPADFNPFVGQPRNNNWGLTTSHNGSLGGGFAWAIHRNNGVDLFVALNQNSGLSGASFDGLFTTMMQGINSVDWANVEPYPQYALP